MTNTNTKTIKHSHFWLQPEESSKTNVCHPGHIKQPLQAWEEMKPPCCTGTPAHSQTHRQSLWPLRFWWHKLQQWFKLGGSSECSVLLKRSTGSSQAGQGTGPLHRQEKWLEKRSFRAEPLTAKTTAQFQLTIRSPSVCDCLSVKRRVKAILDEMKTIYKFNSSLWYSLRLW